MPPQRKSVFGVITTVQPILLLLFSIFILLNAYCEVNFFGKTLLGVMVKTMYLHDPGQCGGRINIGELVEGMPNQAFIRMDRAPFTYYRTLYITWANLVFAIIWPIANELLFRDCTRTIWIVLTLMMSVLDFSTLLIYIDDTYATATLLDLVSYIGAGVSGTGNVVPDTSAVAPVMSLVLSKCAVFLIINCVLIIWLSLNRSELNANDDVEARAVSPMSPQHFVRNSISRIPIRLPRPNLCRNGHGGIPLQLRNMQTGHQPVLATSPVPVHARREVATVLPDPEPVPELTQIQRGLSAEDTRIRVPDAMLSLPQRLEKIIAEEAMKYKFGKTTGNHNETNELYVKYTECWYAVDAGRQVRKRETGFSGRQRKQLQKRTDFHYFNGSGQASSMFRDAPRREPPDVLY